MRSMPSYQRAKLAMADGLDAALTQVEAELPANFPRKLWAAVAAGVKRHRAVFRQGVSASS